MALGRPTHPLPSSIDPLGSLDHISPAFPQFLSVSSRPYRSHHLPSHGLPSQHNHSPLGQNSTWEKNKLLVNLSDVKLESFQQDEQVFGCHAICKRCPKLLLHLSICVVLEGLSCIVGQIDCARLCMAANLPILPVVVYSFIV